MKMNIWKGNIRELKNKIEKAVIFCKSDKISEKDMTLDHTDQESYRVSDGQYEKMCKPGYYESLPSNLTEAKKINSEKFEKEFIMYYLEKNGWNVRLASDEIGMFRQDLYKKIRYHGIKIEKYGKEE